MVLTRRPQRLRSSVPGKNTRIPAQIRKSTTKKQVNYPSQKQDRASKKAKQQSANRVLSAKTPEGCLSENGKRKGTQPYSNNKSAVEGKGSTASPRMSRNLTKMQSILSATFTKDQPLKEKVSRKVGRRTSSIAEASSSQKSVPKESNRPSNGVLQTSLPRRQVSPNKLLPTQSPKKKVHEDMNKNETLPPSIMVAKRGSLRYSQLNNPPPDSIKIKRKVVQETQNKLKSEVKLHSASSKIVKPKSVMLRSSKRKFRRTSISITCTRTVTGYLNTSKSKLMNPNAASNKGSSEVKAINVDGVLESANEESVHSPKVKKSNLTNPNDVSNKGSLETKARNVGGDSNSAKGEASELAPSPKKSKITNPNAASNKGLFEAKTANVAGVSKSAKKEVDKLVKMVKFQKVKKSKCTNPNAVSNKALFKAKAKNVAGVSKSEKEKAKESVNSPKVTKSKKEKKQADVPSPQRVRFSSRKRFPPCERWRGQRPLFRYKQGQGFVFAGISPGWSKDETAGLTIAKNQQKQKIIERLKMKKKEMSKPVTKTPVLDQNTKTEVDVTLHCPFDSVKWTAIAQGDNIPFQLTKTFVSEDVTFGFLDINPSERKDTQYSPDDNIHFVVVKGQLKVVIHHTEFLFNKCDSFIVPCSATYSIENVGSSKALLSFSTFRTPFFPHQEEMSD